MNRGIAYNERDLIEPSAKGIRMQVQQACEVQGRAAKFVGGGAAGFRVRAAAWGVLACLLLGGVLPAQQPAVAPKAKKEDKSDLFFAAGHIPKLKVDLNAEEMQKLRQNNRAYVKCTLTEDDKTVFADVGVKLKGAAGSFRGPDDRPALTLNIDKFQKQAKFHGMDKFHLNNSVQDDTYLHEYVSSEIFRAAGVPAARVGHARVFFNGRDLGLYVLKEGFDTTFLKRYFPKSDGNLYDGGFLQDIDSDLEKDAGKGPDNRSDLHAVRAAAHEADPQVRWNKLADLVDMDAFITFMALERMCCHWDGYCLNCNNYRMYFDPATKKAVFFPHGMDQNFGDPNVDLYFHPRARLSSAVMQYDVWRSKYRERIKALLPLFSPPDALLKKVDEVAARLKPVLEEMNRDQAKGHADRVNWLKDRLKNRAANLVAQAAQPDRPVMEFDAAGVAQLPNGWWGASECEDAKHEQSKMSDGRDSFRIEAGPKQRCVASWRRGMLLPKGDYVFTATANTRGAVQLEQLPFVAVRTSHGERKNEPMGPEDRKTFTCEFSVKEDRRETELVLEFLAKQGRVRFEADTIRLTRKQ